MLGSMLFSHAGYPSISSRMMAAPCRKLRAHAYCFLCAPVSRLHLWLHQKLRRLTKPLQGLRARRTPCPLLAFGKGAETRRLRHARSRWESTTTEGAWSSAWQPLTNRKLLGGLPTLDRRALVLLARRIAYGNDFFKFFNK